MWVGKRGSETDNTKQNNKLRKIANKKVKDKVEI